ncbi:uroporphyrinogen decarboxylase family protein [Mogibacterium sp.]
MYFCGDTKKVLPLMVKAGADMISIDNRVELEFGKSIIEKTVPLIGNVDPVDSMILGKPKDVENAVKKCIKVGHDAQHGYILSTGCDLNGAVPLENLDAFMATARKYGKLPIDSNF